MEFERSLITNRSIPSQKSMITKIMPENATMGFRRNWWSFAYLLTAPSHLTKAWSEKAG
jgi:hypothetical protein